MLGRRRSAGRDCDAGRQCDPAISLEAVVVEHDGLQALEDVTFAVPSGTLMGVVGPNGAGKSTLFDAIAGVHPIASGQVTLSGAGRRREALAYVPQRDSINWRFPATALDVVMMGLIRRIPWYRRPGRQHRDVARSCLERVRLWDRRGALMTELSSGQRQRVFIARALAQDARILLLDEAFSGVDVAAQEGIVRVLQSLRDEGRIVLLATHDLTNLAQRFDQVLCINRHVCACGPPAEAFTPDVLEELYGSHGVEFAEESGLSTRRRS
ncbi:MAG: metal ABC transporter ATP-binding protein [Chloroflexi bacterium]|nr:metal ABC transporter ATP-binding protein [Chloroflexota bacterium]